MRKKIVIVGAGHNGLVVAAYLARAGHDVTVFERRSVVGGCASSDRTTFPGYTLSSASYVNSLFLPEIVRDLDLKKHGYEVLPRNPSSFTPLPDGRFLLLGPDAEFNASEIAKFSKRDALAYPLYEEELGELGAWVAGTMTMTPPNIPPRNWGDIMNGGAALFHACKLLPLKWTRMLKLVLSDPVRYLDRWFESDVLKATLLTDALIGATELSGYVLLHHVMGEAGGARGVWGYMRGGMGGISRALAQAAESHGAKIVCNTSVELVEASEGVKAVLLKDPGGSEWFVGADVVVSNLDPAHTFGRLLSYERGGRREQKNAAALRFDSASSKINCVLSGLPNFRACPGGVPGPAHRGTVHLAPSVDYILKALGECGRGLPSEKPILELTFPSVLDDTLAPSGGHVMNIFLQFTPYESDCGERYFADHVMPVLREYITNIDEILLGKQILAPKDLEREFGLTGGNIFHGALSLGKLFSFRPWRGMADYRTPVRGLYLCGAGTHPGGGVTGACGYNATREILKDIARGL